MLFLRRFVAASNPPNIASPIPANPVLVSLSPVLAKRFGWTFGSAFSTAFVTFLKMWRTFPFSSTTVVTNSYPGIVPLSLVPSSVGFNGFPFSSVHVVDFSTTGVGVGAGVVTFSYTCSISPFGSFLVSTNLYPGISFFGCSPSSVG